MRKVAAFLLTSSLMLGFLVACSHAASADTWSDDFTNPGLQFDPRWEVGGLGQVYPFNGTYAEPVSFTTTETAGWHGPWIKAQVTPSSDFNITLKLDCIADYDRETRGRLEVRLLDQAGTQFYAFGWEDTELTNQYAAINLRGVGNQTLFSTGGSVKYTIYTGKLLSLSRSSGTVRLFIQGNEGFAATASPKALCAVQVSFCKHELNCVPTYMRLDSIAVTTTPAGLPVAPENPACTVADCASSLTWGAPADDGGLPVTSYRVYRGQNPDATLYLTSVGDVLYYNDTGLSNGQSYYYRVSALNGLGEGALSQVVQAIPTGLPGQPRNLQAVSGSDYVLLTWSPPLSDGGSPITNYSLFRDDSRFEVAGDILAFNDTGLVSGREYAYNVLAANSIGEGPASSTVLATPGASLHLPMPPQNLRAREGNSIAFLSWESPSSNGNSYITNYTLYRRTSSCSSTLLILLCAQYEYNDTQLTNGQTYYYSVTATNGIGESPQSDEVSATPTAPMAPSQPMLFKVMPSGNAALLEWAPPLSNGGAFVNSYMVYKGTSPGQRSLLITLGAVCSYTDTDLAWGQEYYYAVSASNSAGEGPQTAEANITLPAVAPVIQDPESGAIGNPITLTSTIVTALMLGITAILLFLFLRKPGKDAGDQSPEGPDKAVDDESDGDAA